MMLARLGFIIRPYSVVLGLFVTRSSTPIRSRRMRDPFAAGRGRLQGERDSGLIGPTATRPPPYPLGNPKSRRLSAGGAFGERPDGLRERPRRPTPLPPRTPRRRRSASGRPG